MCAGRTTTRAAPPAPPPHADPIAPPARRRPSAGEVHARQEQSGAALTARGVAFPSPLMGLSFLGLSVTPALKVTDRGLVDAATLQPVPFAVG